MLDLSAAATLVKNSLVDSGSWVILLTLTSPDDLSVIRICSNTEDVTLSGDVFSAFPFELDDIVSVASGDLPTLSLKVSNINRLVQAYVESDPALGSNWTVLLQVVHSSDAQNFIVYSQDFTNVAWTKVGTITSTASTDEFVGPFGLATATQLQGDGASTSANITQNISAYTGGSTANYSLYVKQNQADLQFNMEIYNAGGAATIYSVNLDFTSGVLTFLGTEAGSGVIGITGISNGWYRVDLAVVGLSTTNLSVILRPSLVGIASANKLLFDAAQLAANLVPYTPIEAVALTDGLLSEPELSLAFVSLSVGADKTWVTFQIGMPNPMRMAIPRTTYSAQYCQHTYKRGGCPYTGALPTCAKDSAACQDHFTTLTTLPILAFPGILAVKIYE